MQKSTRTTTAVLLALNLFWLSFTPSIAGQIPGLPGRYGDPVEKSKSTWLVDRSSVVRTASESNAAVQLSSEPVMRIALSTGVRAATISTTARLLNASEFNSTSLPLETTRVRIESRTRTPSKPVTDRVYEIEIARSLSREEAERTVESVRQLAGVSARIVGEASGKWKVVTPIESLEDADELTAKLEDAGFETSLSPSAAESKDPPVVGPVPSSATRAPVATGNNKLKLTARPSAPNRELVAFARGAAPVLQSSAPMIFASSDEATAPVRFNDKPFRGRIEVFANARGALTVVNVIGLEDYVRGVVPNELSPGGYPAIEAQKAQAIAARTYALKNRGQFASEGYDLLPTTRSQVYKGLSSENSLSSRAVEETRGMIATYNGEPVNAFYTSTCGGRTEDGENIFNTALPYLRGRECAAEIKAPFAPFLIKSSRDLYELKDEKDLPFARDAALLAVNGFSLPSDRISSSWLSAKVSESEVRDWLQAVNRLVRVTSPAKQDELTKPGGFSTALVESVFGDKRADTLLNSADVDYLLAFADAEQIPASNRADVAMLLRDGSLSLFADATLRPKETMSRARALHAIARLLEARSLLSLQKGTTRPAASGVLNLRSNKGKDLPIVPSREIFLFREFGESLYQMKSMALVGGEAIIFHVNAKGEADYLEARPAVNGASAERFSPFTNWTAQMSVGEVQARLGRSVRGVGSISDLRVVARGSSRRVIDLEVVGTQGTGHVRGGRIRSALGLKEQLFVIDRVYSESNRVIGFIFTGRGWGHGVGMCQVGAYGLARQGFTVEQILKAYYTGIEVSKMY
jgi:stage II sporulation protein D